VITGRYLRHGRRRTRDPRAVSGPPRRRSPASVEISCDQPYGDLTRANPGRLTISMLPASGDPSDVGIGERAVWFRDSEGNLLGIGQAKR